jgi:hypothetical protein
MALGGILTRDELTEEVSKNLAGRALDDDPTYARIYRHLNLAQQRIARAKGVKWSELKEERAIGIAVTGNVNTDAFVDIYAKVLSGSAHKLRRIHSIRIVENLSTDHKLVRRLPRQWDRLFPDSRAYATSTSTSDITNYVEWKNNIQLYRVPAAAYSLTLRYSRWPTDFSTQSTPSTTKSDLDGKDDMIIALATHNLLQSLGMREDAQQWFAIYSDLLRDAKADQDDEPDESRIPDGTSETSAPYANEYWRDPFVHGEY